MSLRLPRFQSGRPLLEEVTADKLNQIVDAIRQCEINSGVGYDVTRGPGGATLTIRQDRGIMPLTSGAPYVVGPVNTGIDASGGLISAGTTALNWSVKRPGETSFEPIYVFGENNFSYFWDKTSCSGGAYIRMRYQGVTLSNSDSSRFIGLMTSYQGTVYDYSGVACDNDPPNTVYDPCLGETVNINVYLSQGTSYSAAGAYGDLDDGCGNSTGESGNFTFRCTFNIGDISPSLLKIRFRLRTAGGTGTVTNVLLNSVSASYSPSGTFSTDAGFLETREISEGLKANENTLDFVVNHTNAYIWPGIKCQFEPTTYTIVSKDGEVTGGFANLTTAQQDLLGQGTPVQVKISGVDKIYSYNGTGSKTSSGSYTYIRDV
jgi:hypothetical protein